MKSDQLLEILNKYGPAMPLSQAMSIKKEWDEMRQSLAEYEYAILYAMQIMGFDGNGNLKEKLSPEITSEQRNALGIMLRVHGGYACGIPGMEGSLKNLKKIVPIDKMRVDNISNSMIKGKETEE